jgi:CopA family copper-resistance protein
MKELTLAFLILVICSTSSAQNIKRTAISEFKNLPQPHTIHYDLFVSDTIVDYTGRKRHAIAINGSIPAPTLYFTEGDTAEICVHNNLKKETSIHWHGVILPNQYDGVPYLTTQPILAGQMHLFKFPIVQNGTTWYHSHSKFQEQNGLYGALIFHKRFESDIKEYPLVLSDWSDEKPFEIDRRLHNQTDWYAIRKGASQSYGQAIKEGYLKTKIINEWKRMTAMDVSDVYYDNFLMNGKKELELPDFRAGDKIKLRIVNGSSSTYFWLNYAGGKITIVAADGKDVEPVEVDRVLIGVSETYDIVVTVPENKNYEFLATSEDRTKSVSLWFGKGMKIGAEKLLPLKYFEGMKMMNGMMNMHGNVVNKEGMKMNNQTMDMNAVMYPEMSTNEAGKKGNMEMREMQGMKMDDTVGTRDNMREKASVVPVKKNDENDQMPGMDMGMGSSRKVTLNYGMLRATEKTTLPAWPKRTFIFELTGNMNRYVWTINNKTVSESDEILIKKGENIRIVLYNNTMMRHPMHLHGHYFRVLNGHGDYAPLKFTLDIMPMESDTIEFAAVESGDWFFHCHILYHMMSGMGRIFSYENSPPNPEVADSKMARKMVNMDDKMLHLKAVGGLETNGSEGIVGLSNTRWEASTIWQLGYQDNHGYESETIIGRYLGKNQWWFPFIGFDYHYKALGGPKNIFGSEKYNWFGQLSNKDNRKTAVAGIAYMLPMLFIAEGRVDGNGKFLFQLSRENIALTSRLRLNIMINTDKEYLAGLRYLVTKYLSLSANYNSDRGPGAGVILNY